MNERERTAKKSQFPNRTIEICIVSGAAHCFSVGGAEMFEYRGVDVAQHGINVKGSQTRAIDIFNRTVQSGGDHCFRRVTMCRAHSLAETVIECVVEIEDNAADERPLLGGRRSIGFLALS